MTSVFANLVLFYSGELGIAGTIPSNIAERFEANSNIAEFVGVQTDDMDRICVTRFLGDDDSYLSFMDASGASVLLPARSSVALREYHTIYERFKHDYDNKKGKCLMLGGALFYVDSQAVAGEELRIDQSDGRPYNQQSFLGQYGGLDEWNAAKPAERVGGNSTRFVACVPQECSAERGATYARHAALVYNEGAGYEVDLSVAKPVPPWADLNLDWVIAGVPKSGTTTLMENLGPHLGLF